jgi:hypothetical protein
MEKWLVLMRILAEKLGKCGLISSQAATTNLTQHDPHGPDDPFRTINYHHLNRTYQDMMEWMIRILDGEMAGADEYIG